MVVIPTNPDCPVVPTLRVTVVVIPDTLRSSNSVKPSTSKSPFKSVELVTVTIPVAFM